MTKPSLCRQACRRVDHARVDVEVCMCHKHVHMQVSSRWDALMYNGIRASDADEYTCAGA